MQKTKIHIGQKIIYTKPVNNKIIIQVDKPALRRFSYIILIALALIAYRATVYEAFDMTNLTILLVGLVPFTLYAVYYAYTRSNSDWYIDIQNKKMVLGKIALPFFMIEKIIITKKDSSFNIAIKTKDQKQLILFSSISQDKIMEVGDFFKSVTGIMFDKNVKTG
jgi:hypothetical protein